MSKQKLLAALVSVVAIAAPVPARAARPAQWKEPAHYRFTLEGYCHRGPTSGRWRIIVARRKVVSVTPLDPGLQRPDSVSGFPTLGDLVRRAARADEVSVSVDPRDGHLRDVTFNRSAAPFDGALCYRITAYRVSY